MGARLPQRRPRRRRGSGGARTARLAGARSRPACPGTAPRSPSRRRAGARCQSGPSDPPATSARGGRCKGCATSLLRDPDGAPGGAGARCSRGGRTPAADGVGRRRAARTAAASFASSQAVAISPGGGDDLRRRHVRRHRPGVRPRRQLPLRDRARARSAASPAGSASSAASRPTAAATSTCSTPRTTASRSSTPPTAATARASATTRSSTSSASDPAIGGGHQRERASPSTSARAAPPVVFVVDQGRNRIARFTLDPATLEPVGSPTFAEPGLDAPQGLTLDPAGTRLYVADDQQRPRARARPAELRRPRRRSAATAPAGPVRRALRRRRRRPASRRACTSATTSTTASTSSTRRRSASSARSAASAARPACSRSCARSARSPTTRAAACSSPTARTTASRRWTPAGNVAAAWGIAGRSPGYVQRPRGVAFAGDGATIAVADTFDHRIERFDPDGSYGGQLGLISPFTGYATRGLGRRPVQPAVRRRLRRGRQHRRVGLRQRSRRRAARPTARCCARYARARTRARSSPARPAACSSPSGTDPGRHRRARRRRHETFVRGGLVEPEGRRVRRHDRSSTPTHTRVFQAPPRSRRRSAPRRGITRARLAVHPADGTLYVAEQRPGTANGARVLRGTPSGRRLRLGRRRDRGRRRRPGQRAQRPRAEPRRRHAAVADTSNNRILRLDAPGHGPPPTVRLTRRDRPDHARQRHQRQRDRLRDRLHRSSYGPGRAVTLTATPGGGLDASRAGAAPARARRPARPARSR